MRRILLMNGPNLNMLGIREPGIYGSNTLEALEAMFVEYAESKGLEVACFQSNHEGDLVEKLHEAHVSFDGVVYNPGAHTHYSYAVRDAVGSIATPVVEVHISDVSAREAWRNVSVVAPACVAQVKGRGFQGYCDALDVLLQHEGSFQQLGEDFENAYAPGQVIIAGVSPLRGE